MLTPTQTHPSEEALEAFVLSAPGQPGHDWLEEHLLHCVECLHRAQDAEAFVRVMRAALATQPSRAKVLRFRAVS